MSDYPIVAFVSAPDVSADVRFDFNDCGEWASVGTWPDHEGFSLGAPTFTGDPDAYQAEYGNRQITFNLYVEGTEAAVTAQLSVLARELLRRSNWLYVVKTPFSAPMWYRTFRTAPSALTFDYVGVDAGVNAWGIGVTLDAEAFAYGALVTLPTMTINNDVAAGSNPCYVVLPDIIGDAPAPLKIKASFNTDSLGRKMRFTMTPYDKGAAPAAPIVWQIGGTPDGWTPGTDTSGSVSGGAPAAFYSGGRWRQVSFATQPARIYRLSGLAPAALIPGRYRVLLRMGRESAIDQFEFVMDQVVGDEYGHAYGPPVSFQHPPTVANEHTTWMDLGDQTFPFGTPTEVLTAGMANVVPNIALVVARLAGSFGCRLDAFLIIPVDTVRSDPSTVLTSDFAGRGPKTTEYGYWDGDLETYVTYTTATGALAPEPPPRMGGTFLKVTPGADNALHWLLQTSVTSATTGDNPDVLSDVSTVTLSYHPRWLNMAAA